MSDERLAELIEGWQQSRDAGRESPEWDGHDADYDRSLDDTVAALRELSRLRGQPCCKGLAPPDECKCLRGPTPTGATPLTDARTSDARDWPPSGRVVSADFARQLERKCAAQREALESIRIFARDCIDTGHDRGALGNLYAIVDLCDRHAALKERT